MKTNSKRILLLRYKPVLIFLSLLILGIYTFQTINGITSWRNSYKYFESSQAKLDFDQQVKDSYEFDDTNVGKVFLYYDLKKENTIYTADFDKYKDYSLTIFNSRTDANQQAFNSYTYYNEHFLIFLVIFVTSGILLFLYDLKTNFTAVLFSSKFKRSDIYNQKLLLFGGTLGLSLLIGKLTSLVFYHVMIPNQFFNISIQQHLISTLSGWLTLLAIFLLSSFIGLLFGDWLFGIGTILILFFTFSTFLSNIDFMYQNFFAQDTGMIYTVQNTALNQILPLNQTSTLRFNPVPLLILLITAAISYFLGKFLFKRISLENSGEGILIPEISRVFQICAITYIMIVTSLPTFISTVLPAEPIVTSELVINVLIMTATLVASFLGTEYLLFNKKSKIINRLNFFS